MESNAFGDGTTMAEVIEHYGRAGYDGDMTATEDGDLRCSACGHLAPASRVDVHSIRRLEGASDPADMAAVLAVLCRTCGHRATLVLKFGPEATPGEAKVWAETRDRRDGSAIPRAMAPGEDSSEEGGPRASSEAS